MSSRSVGRRIAAALVALLAVSCGRKGDPVAPGLRLPGPPAQVAISGQGGTLTLSWKPPKQDLAGRAVRPLSGYRVLRQAWPAGSTPCRTCPEDLSPVGRVDTEERRSLGRSETTWEDPDAQPGWTYLYRVRALDADGHPGPVSASAVIVWIPLPATRAEIEAGDRQAILRLDPPPWPRGVEPLGFRAYGPDGRKLAEGPPSVRTLVVPGLKNGTPTTLEVRLAGRTSEGWETEGRGARIPVTPVDATPPLPPWDLAAFVEESGVRLRWLPAAGESYAEVIVLRAREGETFQEIARLPGSATTHVDKDVEAGAVYLYSIVALDAAGNRSLPARDERVRMPKP